MDAFPFSKRFLEAKHKKIVFHSSDKRENRRDILYMNILI